MGKHHGELNLIDINLFSGSSEVFRTAIGGYWEILSSSAGEQIIPIELDDPTETEAEVSITTPVDNHNPFISSVLAILFSIRLTTFDPLCIQHPLLLTHAIPNGVLHTLY